VPSAPTMSAKFGMSPGGHDRHGLLGAAGIDVRTGSFEVGWFALGNLMDVDGNVRPGGRFLMSSVILTPFALLESWAEPTLWPSVVLESTVTGLRL